jgi:hypothetical protein
MVTVDDKINRMLDLVYKLQKSCTQEELVTVNDLIIILSDLSYNQIRNIAVKYNQYKE